MRPVCSTIMAHAQRVFADPAVRKQLATLGNSKGIEPIAILAHGPLLLLSHKPIRAVADFKGQKIRVPGAAPLQIEPFKKLGAAPVSMPLGEVLSAMQNRTIDGLIASATVFTAFKYYDLAKGLTALPGSFLIAPVMANRNFLKSLGPELEAMVREEAFKAQQKVEKFGVEDVGRTADVWKKNGGENIVLPEGGEQGLSRSGEVGSARPAQCQCRDQGRLRRASRPPHSRPTEAYAVVATLRSISMWTRSSHGLERVLAIGLLIGHLSQLHQRRRTLSCAALR